MFKIADLPGPQNFRDKRALELVNELTGYVTNIDSLAVDFGSGQGEIPAEMARRGWSVICIDLFTTPSKKVDNSEVRKNMTWILGDATKKIDLLKIRLFESIL